MAKTTDLSSMKHMLASQLHLYYETQDDGTNVLRHIRVHQRNFEVPSEGISIDSLPDNFIGSEQIKDGTMDMADLSPNVKDSMVKATEKGSKGGIATLDDDGKVSTSQLPETPVAKESDVRGIVSGYTV